MSYARLNVLPILALLLVGCSFANRLPAEEVKASAAASFELPPVVEVSDVVPASLRDGKNFTLSNDVSVADCFYQFHVVSPNFGEFDIGSLDLLFVRAYEINVLAGVPEIKGSTEFGRAAKSDITETAKATAKTIVTPVKSAKALVASLEDDGRAAYDFIRLRKRNQPKDSLLTGEEKRRQAHSLGLDVYSTNPAVQDYLAHLAKARSPGSKLIDVSISVTTFVMPFGMPVSLAISAGKYREKLNDKFDTMSPMELYRYNDKILKKMDVKSEQREQFLEYAELSPRHKTEIVADLKTLEQLSDRATFLEACHEPHPSEGVWQLQCADMLAKYNKTVEPIQFASGAGIALTTATATGKRVIFLPADVVFWNEAVAKVFEVGSSTLGANPPAIQECVTTGRVTDRAKKEIEAHGFTIRDHFLREENIGETVEIKP